VLQHLSTHASSQTGKAEVLKAPGPRAEKSRSKLQQDHIHFAEYYLCHIRHAPVIFGLVPGRWICCPILNKIAGRNDGWREDVQPYLAGEGRMIRSEVPNCF